MNTQELVRVEQVTRSYPSRTGAVQVLRNLSLRVLAGTLVALMGPSGSGKTTLLNLIGGLDTPTSGGMWVLGQEMTRLSVGERAALRRRIGFIFQSFALLPTATALENVELGLRVAEAEPRHSWTTRSRYSLAAVGLSAWADHRPGELSGGQQQRVAIARALASEPQLLLADEPTGDLDSQMGAQVLRLLQGYVQRTGAACIIASHDPAVAAAADVCFRFEHGTLTAANENGG
jgi:ABC-type lipoprotein export system ATPase subunit